MIAYDELRQDVIQFKVDRVRGAVLLDQIYVIPETFDFETYLGSSWGIMRGEAREPEDVVLVFEPEAGRWVAEEQWHRSQKVETQADGFVRVSFHVGVTPEMVSWLLYYGARVQVVAPGWLRDRVREEHRRAAGMEGGA
jgi:predicted DNA-binding transcriptional regulator YafY